MATVRHLVTAIKQDLYRRTDGGGGLWTFIRYYCMNPDFKFVAVYRCCNIGREIPVFRTLLFPLFALEKHRLSAKFGVGIATKMKIGRGFRIDHLHGIYLAADTEIGSNCNISCGVVFGNIPRGIHKGVPERIGDGVYIGPDAKILGRVSVGDDAVIGANAVVTKSVPACASVMGVPARVVAIEGSDDYVRFRVEPGPVIASGSKRSASVSS